MRFLKTNTAVIVTVGPFYDKDDGVTIENALTATNERITLTVDLDDGSAPTLVLDNVTGAASGTSNDIVVITNCDAGLYQIELSAANVNYLGRAMLTITDAANHVPVFHEFQIVTAQFYNFMCGAETILDVNVTKVGGTSQTAGDVVAKVDVVDGIVDDILVDTAVIGALGAGLTALASQASVDVIDGIVDDILTDTAAATPALIADAVWDEALTGATHNVATSAGKRLRAVGDAVGGTVNDAAASTTVFITTLTAKANDFYNDQIMLFVDGNLAGQCRAISDWIGASGTCTVEEPWSEAPANGDAFDIIPAHVHPMAEIASAVWDDALASHAVAGSFGKAVADIETDAGSIATVDAKVDLILADTDELQTDLTDGGRLDLILDAVLLDTGTTLETTVNAISGVVDDILEDTAVIGALGAGLTALATQASVDLIAADVSAVDDTLAVGGDLHLQIDIAAAGNSPSAIADAVWDEAMADHVAAGSFGEGIANAASAGDPWSTPIPGAYAVGTAGKKVSDMVAEVTAILVDTGTTLDGKIDVIDGIVDSILVDTGTTLDAALAVVDANVDAILVDTGTSIPADIAAVQVTVDAIEAGTTPPTVGAIADAVWDEVLNTGHAVGNSAAVLLTAASAGLATAVAGLGAIACTITVNISGVPLQDCDVWVTSDEAGTTIVAGTLQTDASGQCIFYLDAGTYYVWQQKTGYNFTLPDELVVT